MFAAQEVDSDRRLYVNLDQTLEVGKYGRWVIDYTLCEDSTCADDGRRTESQLIRIENPCRDVKLKVKEPLQFEADYEEMAASEP